MVVFFYKTVINKILPLFEKTVASLLSITVTSDHYRIPLSLFIFSSCSTGVQKVSLPLFLLILETIIN